MGSASWALWPRRTTSVQMTRTWWHKARARVSKSRPWRERPCTHTTTCGCCGLPVAFHSRHAMPGCRGPRWGLGCRAGAGYVVQPRFNHGWESQKRCSIILSLHRNSFGERSMLKGKTALVTGSTSGIGLGIAKCLARQGANVVLNGFGDSEGPRAEVLAAGQQAGVRVAYHGADMSRAADIEDMMAFAAREFGRVDILVNNAGIQHVANVEDFPAERWDAIIAINLTSAFHTTRLALPAMKAANWGRIINVASVHGLVASAQKAAYVAAKP